jgi:hypothetical protein
VHCHVCYGSGPYLPVETGPTLSRAPRLQTPPPCSRGLRCCPVSHDFSPRLLAREDFDVAMCHTALDSASLFGRAPVLPRVTQLWIPPPCSRRLPYCHMPYGSGPCLPAHEGSGAITCLMTLRGSRTLKIKKGSACLPMRLSVP